MVLARPVHISAGSHELAGDACTETAALAYFPGHIPETQLKMFLSQEMAKADVQTCTFQPEPSGFAYGWQGANVCGGVAPIQMLVLL